MIWLEVGREEEAAEEVWHVEQVPWKEEGKRREGGKKNQDKGGGRMRRDGNVEKEQMRETIGRKGIKRREID